MLDGNGPDDGLADKSEEFLDSLAGDELGFVILWIDVVGSTKLATTVDPKVYRTMIRTLLYELSETIPLFNGHVLKYTGDGLVAYLPEPSFIRKNDLALDCAPTLRGLVRDALNPKLREREMPALDVPIGIDAGKAFVETVGSPETKPHPRHYRRRGEPGHEDPGPSASGRNLPRADRSAESPYRPAEGLHARRRSERLVVQGLEGESYPFYRFGS